MSQIKYLLDEHVNPRLRKALKSTSPDMVVWRIGDAGVPGFGTLDPEILIWCETNRFILVTNNRASMPVHLKDHLNVGRHIPGIFILNPKMSFGDLVDELLLIWEASEMKDYVDQMWYLPLS